jgi:hypothetical protein
MSLQATQGIFDGLCRSMRLPQLERTRCTAHRAALAARQHSHTVPKPPRQMSDYAQHSIRTLVEEGGMNVISVIIGLVALVIALVGFIPLLGWLNWFVIPGAAVGLVLGLMSRKTSGRNINLVVLALAIIRLALGGGIL